MSQTENIFVFQNYELCLGIGGPGLHQKWTDQQAKGGDCPPLFCFGGTPPRGVFKNYLFILLLFSCGLICFGFFNNKKKYFIQLCTRKMLIH